MEARLAGNIDIRLEPVGAGWQSMTPEEAPGAADAWMQADSGDDRLPDFPWPTWLYPHGPKHRAFVLMRQGAWPSGVESREVVQLLDDTFIVEATVEQFRDMARQPDVIYIEALRPMGADLLTSVAATRADSLHSLATGKLTGEGVVIGIVDLGGLDFTLDDFRDPITNNTRIAFLWDQNLTPIGNERAPQGYKHGVEYTTSDIDAHLAAPSGRGAVRHRAVANSHATHVAGIAVGNGRSWDPKFAAGMYVGAAPEATIIYVEAARQPGIPLTSSDRVAEAIAYVFGKAKEMDKPCVVNVSLGNNGGSHDAESVVERTIDRFLEEPGRVLVKSAGNEGDWKTHTSDVLMQGGKSVQLQWQVGGGLKVNPVPAHHGDRTANELEVWYSSRDRIRARVHHPATSGSPPPCTPWVEPGQDATSTLGHDIVKISSERFHKLNGGARIWVKADLGPGQSRLQSGVWILELDPMDIKDGRFDVWIERDRRDQYNSFADQSTFPAASSPAEKSLSPPATIRRGITVANYDHAAKPPAPHPGSSLGPTRDGREKPDVAAPGTDIVSSAAGGSTSGTPPIRVSKSGTSMSAPHVAGICALLQQARVLNTQPLLTAVQMKAVLIASAQSATGPAFHPQWGFGSLDAVTAEQLVR